MPNATMGFTPKNTKQMPNASFLSSNRTLPKQRLMPNSPDCHSALGFLRRATENSPTPAEITRIHIQGEPTRLKLFTTERTNAYPPDTRHSHPPPRTRHWFFPPIFSRPNPSPNPAGTQPDPPARLKLLHTETPPAPSQISQMYM